MAITLREITEDNRQDVLALVGAAHQGRGVGREVVRQVLEIVRTHGGAELLTSHVPGDDGPAGFYARLGFVPTGELDADREILLRRDLTEQP